MDTLPSYEQATSGPDWLCLVVPFVQPLSWRQCCLVNKKFYRQFAPLLWQDPLATVRQLGLDPNDGKHDSHDECLKFKRRKLFRRMYVYCDSRVTDITISMMVS